MPCGSSCGTFSRRLAGRSTVRSLLTATHEVNLVAI
jgi:hypothetical protein